MILGGLHQSLVEILYRPRNLYLLCPEIPYPVLIFLNIISQMKLHGDKCLVPVVELANDLPNGELEHAQASSIFAQVHSFNWIISAGGTFINGNIS